MCLSDPLHMPVSLGTIANLAKQRGFVYQSSEIYGGTRSAYDYGPLGVELLRNVKERAVRLVFEQQGEYPTPISAHGEADVRDGRRADELDVVVAIWATVKVVEEPLAAAEQDGHDHQVHVVDQASAEILLNGGSATADPDVVSVGGVERLLERRLDAVMNEIERGTALHRDGRTWVVGKHEHGVVEGRVVPPLACPLVAGPWSTDRSEHVAPHDGGADAFVALCDEVVVEALVAAVHAGARKIPLRMSEAVALTKIHDPHHVDKALGLTATAGRFAPRGSGIHPRGRGEVGADPTAGGWFAAARHRSLGGHRGEQRRAMTAAHLPSLPVLAELVELCRRLRLKYVREQMPEATAKPSDGSPPRPCGCFSSLKSKAGTAPLSKSIAGGIGSRPARPSTSGMGPARASPPHPARPSLPRMDQPGRELGDLWPLGDRQEPHLRSPRSTCHRPRTHRGLVLDRGPRSPHPPAPGRRQHRQRAGSIIRSDLIVVDDIGLLPISADAAEGFYRLVDACYEQRSLAVSSNLHPSAFYQLIDQPGLGSG